MGEIGRPEEYQEEYVLKVDEYLATCIDEDINYVTLDSAKATGYQKRVNVKLPSYEGFAKFLGVSRTSLAEWREKHKSFSVALERISAEQKQRLFEKGLSGDYNPTIAKLGLSANHGMREKSDITTDGAKLPSPIYGGSSE